MKFSELPHMLPACWSARNTEERLGGMELSLLAGRDSDGASA